MGEAKRRGTYEERKAMAITVREVAHAAANAKREAERKSAPHRRVGHLGGRFAIAASMMAAMGNSEPGHE